METALIIKENEESNECIICLDECDKISETFLEKPCKCKYYLHKKCLINWINVNKENSCLICKETVILKESPYAKCGRVICLPRNQVYIKRTISKFFLVLFYCFIMYLIFKFIFIR